MQDEQTYTFEEADIIMHKFIKEQSEILRKNLREKRRHNEIEYV